MTSPSSINVCYVTGTRADFGLMFRTLDRLHRDPAVYLSICLTGMHMLAAHGNTVDEVERSGFRIGARVPVDLDGSALAMALALGEQVQGLAKAFVDLRPDVVLLLGDRGEMLASAIAALHLGIQVVHVHGGERSGTVDEPVRHAISKLSHWHCVATAESRERLLKMGEDPQHVFITGAPGLDGIAQDASFSRDDLCSRYQLDASRPCALLLVHPAVQDADGAGFDATNAMRVCLQRSFQIVALMPNSDAGSGAVRAALHAFQDVADVRLRLHIPRHEFLSWLRWADLLVGNSSSGIIEAASFGLPVVNIGPRQRLRERNINVIDSAVDEQSIGAAVDAAVTHGRFDGKNNYGDGNAADRIAAVIRNAASAPASEGKTNAY